MSNIKKKEIYMGVWVYARYDCNYLYSSDFAK
jgi:hypothetical protein